MSGDCRPISVGTLSMTCAMRTPRLSFKQGVQLKLSRVDSI